MLLIVAAETRAINGTASKVLAHTSRQHKSFRDVTNKPGVAQDETLDTMQLDKEPDILFKQEKIGVNLLQQGSQSARNNY